MVSVEDEWERYPQSTKILDLLFVTYDPQEISVEELKEAIAKHKFKVKIR